MNYVVSPTWFNCIALLV